MVVSGKTGWGQLLIERRLARFVLICLGIWLNAADALVTATIMPSVAADIGGYAYFAWTTSAFILGTIVAGASAGLVSLRTGLRFSMVASALVYVVGCVISAVAPEIFLFIFGRLLQGLGAGAVVGLCYVAIGTVFPENLWARILASVSAIWGGATLLGPLIGGLFAEAGLWRWAFWFFAVQGIGFAIASAFLLQAVKPDEAAGKLPLRQLVMLTGGIVAIAVAGLLADVTYAIALGLAGFALFVAFVRVDARAPSPLLPRSTQSFATAAGSGYLMIFAMSVSAITLSVYGAAILQAVFNASPLFAGYILAIESAAWTVTALAVAGLKVRWESLFLKLGALSVLIASVLLAFTMDAGPLWAIALAAAFLGGGFGLAWSFITRRVITSVPEEERALASSAVPSMQMIGYAAGSAVAGVIANFLGFAEGIDAAIAKVIAFPLFISFVPVACVAVVAAWRLSSRRFD